MPEVYNTNTMNIIRFSLLLFCFLPAVVYCVETPELAAELKPFPREDGYRGIWYSNQPSKDEYVYKYSGGLGTYCAKHIPLAEYAPAVDKTFFVYGGSKGLQAEKPLLIMASYFDHKTGMVPRPVVVMEKGTNDAHHNPTLCIDGEGFVWIFASSHGGKDGFIWKSRAPYSIDSFDLVMQREFTYPQPRFMEGFGILFLFSKYTGGRELYANSSRDGFAPEKDRKLAGFDGHYQISGGRKTKRGTAFNWHPPPRRAECAHQYLFHGDPGLWRNVDERKGIAAGNAPDLAPERRAGSRLSCRRSFGLY